MNAELHRHSRLHPRLSSFISCQPVARAMHYAPVGAPQQMGNPQGLHPHTLEKLICESEVAEMLPFCQIFCLRYHWTASPGWDSHCHAPPRNVVGHACSTLTLSMSALEISHQRQKSAVVAWHGYGSMARQKHRLGWGEAEMARGRGACRGTATENVCPLNVGRWLEEEPYVS